MESGYVEIKRPKRAVIGAILVGVIVGLIYYLPNTIISRHAGESGMIYRASLGDLDEGFAYGTRVREALDGDYSEGDPYLVEYKGMPNIWETNYAAVIFGGILKIFHAKNIDFLFSFGDFLFPCLLYIIVFYLFYGITRHKLYSFFSALIVLLFPNFFILKDFAGIDFWRTLSFYGFFSIFERGFNAGLSRIFVPAVYLPVLFLFFIFLLKATSDGRKKYIVPAGIFFGLCFYTYFYYWIFAVAVVVCFIFLLLLAGEKKRFFDALNVFVLGAIISVPLWIKMIYLRSFPAYGEYALRVGRETGRFVRWESADLYIFIGLLICFLAYYWRKTKSVLAIFTISLLLCVIAVLNMQLVTGFNIQPDHWGSRLNVYIVSFSLLASAHLLSAKLKSERARKYFNFSLGVLVVAGLITGFLAQTVRASVKYNDYMAEKNVYTALQWMNENTERGSVVATPSLYMNFIIPIVTHNNIYFPPSCRSMASEAEILQRFYETSAIFGVKSGYLEYGMGLAAKTRFAWRDADYGKFLFCDTYLNGPEKTAIPKDTARRILAAQEKFNIADKGAARFIFRADYLFYGPEERVMGRFDTRNYKNLEEVYSNDAVKIYRIK